MRLSGPGRVEVRAGVKNHRTNKALAPQPPVLRVIDSQSKFSGSANPSRRRAQRASNDCLPAQQIGDFITASRRDLRFRRFDLRARGAWLEIAGLIAEIGDGKELRFPGSILTWADLPHWLNVTSAQCDELLASLSSAGLLIVESDRLELPDWVGGIAFGHARRWRVR